MEGLTANKISVIEHLASKYKALVILLQETHCISADKLVIPHFTLAGSILSRKHGIAMFVHEQLSWSLVGQSPNTSEIEWLCIDIEGYKIINVYKPPPSQMLPTAIPVFPPPPALAISTASTLTGDTPTSPEWRLLPWAIIKTSLCFTT